MIHKKQSHESNKKNITNYKDDELSPKGLPSHIIAPDWPTKDSVKLPKKRKIKRTENAKFP